MCNPSCLPDGLQIRPTKSLALAPARPPEVNPMECERFLNLISARLDREIGADDLAELERHLETCPDCRAASEAFSLQHRELRGAFLERRAAAAGTAAATAARVHTAAAADRTGPRPPRRPGEGKQTWLWAAAV